MKTLPVIQVLVHLKSQIPTSHLSEAISSTWIHFLVALDRCLMCCQCSRQLGSQGSTSLQRTMGKGSHGDSAGETMGAMCCCIDALPLGSTCICFTTSLRTGLDFLVVLVCSAGALAASSCFFETTFDVVVQVI